VADWVSWANSSVTIGAHLSLVERNTTVFLLAFLPMEEGKKRERKRKTVATAIEIHPSSC